MISLISTAASRRWSTTPRGPQPSRDRSSTLMTSAELDGIILFFSSGSCCNLNRKTLSPGDEYKIMVCRSERLDGDYVDAEGRSCVDGGGTMVLASHGDIYAPGGQGVYFDEDRSGPVMYYHYLRESSGIGNHQVYFGWNPMDFSSGWPRLTPAPWLLQRHRRAAVWWKQR